MAQSPWRVLITGANGFIGKNLQLHLQERAGTVVSTFLRGDSLERLPALLAQADAVVHLAGENRPADEAAFAQVNTGLTAALCNAMAQEMQATGRHIPLVLASSTQALRDNAYGRSKLAAEDAVRALSDATGNPCVVFRLPGVFGKWCKPHYNSVVATFCHQIARGLPIVVNDAAAALQLVYIDDVVAAMVDALQTAAPGCAQAQVQPLYSVTLGELAAQIQNFGDCRSTLMSERVGTGLTRALYATYVSYLPVDKFSYPLPQHADPRGVFVEMLKTPDSGQFSYFTAHPGVTRGGHYHHSKTEKFLVIQGDALFRFRHMLTNERFELRTSGTQAQVVDTIPGWAHDITNVGSIDMVVMLWANENFDRNKPDTVASNV
jgi:UDP-2-acetamido-2,6-beta-L-arabino-hexul-4-ose reductase